MSKEHLFIDVKMWLEEDGDGQPKSIRYDYKLPNPENEMIVELYKMFLETLCSEIAQLDAATEILSILGGTNEEDRDNS
jgi:hypothetical protein